MCGILGLYYADPQEQAYGSIVDGLTVLQHRGQDAAGMVTSTKHQLHLRKDRGLVRDVLGNAANNASSSSSSSSSTTSILPGPMGLGHVRYPTAGATANCASEAQPLYTNTPFGICIAHNGTITNTAALTPQMDRHLNTESDSEVLLNWFAMELGKAKRAMDDAASSSTTTTTTTTSTTPALLEPIFTAVASVMTHCTGGFAGVLLLHGIGLVAFRDPHGIRPLVWGQRASMTLPTSSSSGGGMDSCVCSESVALDALGFPLVRDIRPGEALFIDTTPHTGQGRIYSRIVHPNPSLTPCIFEYVYFARPDSIMDGCSVYQTRLHMGERLARNILDTYGEDHGIDVVIPIPDTSRSAALQAAEILRVPYREGFIKNRYIARTFIMPGQQRRKKNVRLKLNPIQSEFRGKAVLLVDDSIVRGTTATAMIQLAWDAGATRVHVCSAAPPILYPNIYGIDIPTQHELVAFQRTPAEIAKQLGCTWVVYQALEDLTAAVTDAADTTETHTDTTTSPSSSKSTNTNKNITPTHFETSCFSGKYVTGESIDDPYFATLHAQRNDAAQHGGDSSTRVQGGANEATCCESINNPAVNGQTSSTGAARANSSSSPCEPITPIK